MESKEELDYNEEEQYVETSEDKAGEFNARKNSEKLAKSIPVGGVKGAIIKKVLEKGGGSGGNPATNNMLKQAWLQIPATWGLSALWINVHAFLSKVFGKKAFRKLKTIEGMGIVLINLGCLAIVIGLITLMGMLYEVTKQPFRVFWKAVFK